MSTTFEAFIVKSKIVLDVDGDVYPVLNCSYNFARTKDYDGQPTSPPRCNEIRIVMEATEKDKILSWMASNELKDGTITFKKRMDETKLKELKFAQAFVFDYQEAFDESGTGTVTFAISPSTVNVGEAEFNNEWVLDSAE